MTRRSVWMLMLCVFFAGVFFGIWMDWSAHKAAGRDLVFEVQDYQMANLLVYPGDRLYLVPPPAGGGTSVTMGWVGNIPCVGGGTATNCTIESRAKAPAGPYFFTCDSSTYSCPDPGVQQSPTGPIQDFSYKGFVEADFSHLVGIKRSYVKKQEPSATAEAHPASGSLIKAIVSCSQRHHGVAGSGRQRSDNDQRVGRSDRLLDQPPTIFSEHEQRPRRALFEGQPWKRRQPSSPRSAVSTWLCQSPFSIRCRRKHRRRAAHFPLLWPPQRLSTNLPRNSTIFAAESGGINSVPEPSPDGMAGSVRSGHRFLRAREGFFSRPFRKARTNLPNVSVCR